MMKDAQFDFTDTAMVETPLASDLRRTNRPKCSTRRAVCAGSGGQRRPVSGGAARGVSNSLRVVDTVLNSKGLPIEFRRVNLLETGLVFDGRIDIKFANVFGPFRAVAGRLRDIDDCRRLGIRETGEIAYPPGYQPFARNGWKISRGLMPESDEAEKVEAFLKSGGETWKADFKDDPLPHEEMLWIWPVTDHVIRNRDSSIAPPDPLAAAAGQKSSRGRPGLHYQNARGNHRRPDFSVRQCAGRHHELYAWRTGLFGRCRILVDHRREKPQALQQRRSAHGKDQARGGTRCGRAKIRLRTRVDESV